MSSPSSERYPAPIASIAAIRQQDLLALAAADQDRELAAFDERLRAWADRMSACGGGGPAVVSVEIPVFKGGWIMPAIESVLYQSSTCWSLSVRWDSGDELSRRILESLERLGHPRIHVYFGENRGIAYNRRFLTEHSHGDYIVPLDDDDMLAPDAIETFLAVARARPWIGILRAKRDFIDEVGRPVESDPWFPFEPRHYQHGMVCDVFNHSQPTLISRSAYVKTVGWEGFEEFRFAGEDCDLYLKIEEVAPIELLDRVLYFYRISGRRTSLVITDDAAFEMWRRLADRSIARIGLPLRRTNDTPPFTYERLPRPRPTAADVDVVAHDGAAARNEGFARTTRPLVLFVRQGIEVPDTGTIDRLLAAMHEADADMIGPAIVASTDAAGATSADATVAEASWLPSTVLLVRREVMNAVGGFEPGRADIIADKDFSLKARRRDFKCVRAGSVSIADRAAASAAPSADDAEWLTAKWEDDIALLASVDGIAVNYEKVYEHGVALLQGGHVEEAMAALRRVTKIRPKFFWGFHSLGDALYQLQRWDEAATAYRRAIELDSSVSWSHHHLGNSLTKLQHWNEAAAAYRRAIEVEPGVAAAHKNLGLALLRVSDFSGAAAAFEHAVALEPSDFWSHYSHGDALSALRRWEPAAESYRRALAIRGDVTAAHLNLGNALVRLERWADAAAAFARVLEIEPDSVTALVNLGNALSKTERWADAVAVCDRAIALDSTSFWAYQLKGAALLKLRRWAEAEAALQRAVDLAPALAWSHHYLGDSLLQLDRFEEAAAAYQRAIDLEPKLFWSHNNLGETLLKLRRLDDAVVAFEGAIAARPDLSVAHHNLGDALVKCGRWDDAAAAYARADELNPAWARRDVTTAIAPLERWLDGLTASSTNTVSPEDAALPRLLFVFDDDYGEVTTTMYLLLGQRLAQRATFLLPPRLYGNNKDTLPGRTQIYRSPQDVIDAVDAQHPDVVFLSSGYLFPIHGIFSPDVLQDLVDALSARGCRIVTTDPFLGLLSNLGTSTRISIDIPDNAPPQLVKVKHEQDRRLIDNFSRAVTVLRDLPHLYPVFPAPPGEVPRTDEVDPVSFFNPKLLIDDAVDPEARGGGDQAPQWLFVLASRDYEVQVIFHGKEWFVDLLARKLEETVRAGRHPVFIGPYDCVQALLYRLAAAGGSAVRDGVTLLTFCPFRKFSALLLHAEYVFYWNALSHSMFLRLFNERPVFLFDKGHLVRNVVPLYERIVAWYYQGWDPIYIEQEDVLNPAALQPLAEVYRRAAHDVVRHARRSPSPNEMVERLVAGSSNPEAAGRRARPAPSVVPS